MSDNTGKKAFTESRYPGARPFQDTSIDRRLFFGRDRERQLLFHKVLAEKLVVLYAKSGMGKTSLLNAGVLKLLRDRDFAPIMIRFNDPALTPLQTVYERMKAAAEQEEGTCDAHQSLWDYVDTFRFTTLDVWTLEDIPLKPVLILDQFEEFFTLHDPAQRESFITQLAELVKGRNPSESPLPVKIIISLREDFLGQLEDMASQLPHILQNRFRLSALSREQAQQAIEEPARVEDKQIVTTSFEYAPETVNTMLDFLCKQRQQDNAVRLAGEVEPFQLQLLCQHVEHEFRKQQKPGDLENVLHAELLGGEAGMQQVLEEFYDEQIKQLGSARQQNRVRNLFESGLIDANDRRMSLEQGDIHRRFNVPEPLLARLIECRLLRKDPRVGSWYYELSHDTLIEPIRKSQRRRKRRKTTMTGIIVGCTLLLLLVITYFQRETIIDYYVDRMLYPQAEEFAEAEKDEKAIEAYHAIIRWDNTSPRAYAKLAELYMKQGNPKEAIKADNKSLRQYRQAIALDRNSFDAYKGEADLYLKYRKNQRALKVYEDALTVSDKAEHAKIYHQLGKIYDNLEKFEKAIASYLKAINLDSEFVAAYKDLTSSYLRQGDLQAAIRVTGQASSTIKNVSEQDKQSFIKVAEWATDMQTLISVVRPHFGVPETLNLLSKYQAQETTAVRVESKFWEEIKDAAGQHIVDSIKQLQNRTLGCGNFTLEFRKIKEINDVFNQETLEGYVKSKELSDELRKPDSVQFITNLLDWLAAAKAYSAPDNNSWDNDWFVQQLKLAIENPPDYPKIVGRIDAQVQQTSNPVDRFLGNLVVAEIYLNYDLEFPAKERYDEAVRTLSALSSKMPQNAPLSELGLHMASGLVYERLCGHQALAVKEFQQVVNLAKKVGVECEFSLAYYHLGMLRLPLKPENEIVAQGGSKFRTEEIQFSPTPTPVPTPTPPPVNITITIPSTRMSSTEVQKGLIQTREIRLRSRSYIETTPAHYSLYDLARIPEEAARAFEFYLRCKSYGGNAEIARFFHQAYRENMGK